MMREKNPPPTDHDPRKPSWPVVACWVVGVLLLLAVGGWIPRLVLGGWDNSGVFGDTFGLVNAGFSGLAFLGVIYAIILQSRELELQRKELHHSVEAIKRSAEAQEESNTFAAVSRISQQMDGDAAIQARHYLLHEFEGKFIQAMKNMDYGEYLGGGFVDIGAVLKGKSKRRADRFDAGLDAVQVSDGHTPRQSLLYIAERVLGDLDIIAIPYVLHWAKATEAPRHEIEAVERKIEAIERIPGAYAAIFRDTARFLLPFVAMKILHREPEEKTYKAHYLRVLHDLEILKKQDPPLIYENGDLKVMPNP